MQFISIMFVILSLRPVALDDSRRVARIIGGASLVEVDRPTAPFKALEYHVWIGESWDIDREWWIIQCRKIPPCLLGNEIGIWLGGKLDFLEKPERYQCGGALIAPNVVQTACHCVSDFVRRDGAPFGTFEIKSNWEEQYFVYMGAIYVRTFKNPIRTYRFHAHEDCGKLWDYPRYNRYDVGWIVLEEDVGDSDGVENGRWGNLDYAGPYRHGQLQEFSERVIAQRHVCLVMGYGETKENISAESPPKPASNIKYGWIQIIDWQNCFEAIWLATTLHKYVDYNVSDSWVCSQPLHNPYEAPFLGALAWHGDSGSPITCNNNYFALVSTHHKYTGKLKAGFQNMSLGFPIYQDPEANTVEERRQFEEDLYLWGTYRYRHGPPDELRAVTVNGAIGHPIRKLAGSDYKNQWKNPGAKRSSSGRSFLSMWAYLLYFLNTGVRTVYGRR